MTAEQFKILFGREPELDDLDRVNCPDAGKLGHSQCGICGTCNKPKFECFCMANRYALRNSHKRFDWSLAKDYINKLLDK
jgi:hypothetical protein